ncbi:MAG: DUF433 domain-containing protein [Cuspidothrix sp.]
MSVKHSLMASGHSANDILKAYPYLEEADIHEVLVYSYYPFPNS